MGEGVGGMKIPHKVVKNLRSNYPSGGVGKIPEACQASPWPNKQLPHSSSCIGWGGSGVERRGLQVKGTVFRFRELFRFRKYIWSQSLKIACPLSQQLYGHKNLSLL